MPVPAPLRRLVAQGQPLQMDLVPPEAQLQIRTQPRVEVESFDRASRLLLRTLVLAPRSFAVALAGFLLILVAAPARLAQLTRVASSLVWGRQSACPTSYVLAAIRSDCLLMSCFLSARGVSGSIGRSAVLGEWSTADRNHFSSDPDFL